MANQQQAKPQGVALGLGQVYDEKNMPKNPRGFLGAMLKCPFQSVPVTEYTRWTTTLPLTDEVAAQTFGPKLNPLQQTGAVPGILNATSSFIVGSILQCHMICFGIGIHVWGEPLQFQVEGNSYAATATAPIASPDVFTLNDLTNNALGNETVLDSTENNVVVPAVLEWGFATWMAGWHMAHAYEVNWFFNQRYTILKEPLSDLCYFGPYADCPGAGTSSVSAQEFFKQVNDDYTSNLASPKIIQPVGFQRLGSINVGGASTGANYAVMRATRNYDTVDATFGGLRNNQAVCGSPFRKFSSPVFIEKGIPIGLLLQMTDTYHWGEMQRFISVSESGASVPANVPFSSLFAGTAGAEFTTAGTVTTAVEQTLNPTTNLVTQQVNTTRDIYKGGSFETEFLIKGYEINDRAWMSHIQAAITSGQITNANSTTGVGLVPMDA